MILLELVPRDFTSLEQEVTKTYKEFPQVEGINLPDILEFKLRSHDATEYVLKKNPNTQIVPHYRAIDRSVDSALKITENLYELGMRKVLIVSGDKPKGFQKTYPVTPLKLIPALKKSFPDLNVYCGLDPYRTAFRDELDYCEQKIDAGADGFFTQPFFDKDLARIYLEHLEHTEVFLGISPILYESSRNYWLTKNKAFFPKEFQLDMEYNCQLAKDLMALAKSFNQNVYLMPILVPVFEYLEGVFS
jgi:methylenetetrahydrofolate reductase (NADPH)